MRKHGNNKDNDPDQWVDTFGDYLYRYTLPRVRDPLVAEDLVQETFYAAVKSRHSFKQQSNLKTWLTGILKHKIIDHYRRMTQEQKKLASLDSSRLSVDDIFDAGGNWRSKPGRWAATPERLFEEQEFMTVLLRCLAGMPERLASAFIMKEMDDESSEKICKVLKVTSTNLWVMLYRGRMALRKCLGKSWFEEDVP